MSYLQGNPSFEPISPAFHCTLPPGRLEVPSQTHKAKLTGVSRLLKLGHKHHGYHSTYSHMQYAYCRIYTILMEYRRTPSFSTLRIRTPIAINNRLLLRSPLKRRTLILLRLASYHSRTLYRIRPPWTRHRPRLTTTRTTVCAILDSMRRKLR